MKKLHILLIIFVCGILFWSCVKDNTTSEETEPQLSFRQSSVEYTSMYQFLDVTANSQWVISVSYPQGQTAWINEIKPKEGTGSMGVQIYYSKNETSANRTATFTLTTPKFQTQITLTQKSKDNASNPEGYNALELPYCKPTDDLTFVTHYITLSGIKVRNFSIFYDKSNKYPLWVAYPIHSKWLGSTDRTDDWGYDPVIAQEFQPELFSSFESGYDRGHVLPSASRTVTREANSQTFYFTNMTAQNSTFNQQRWANLENKVRTYKGTASYDTLYVVSGNVLRTVGGNEPIKYSSRRPGTAIPNYYYKVLLKQTPDGSFKSIGFWYEHKAATGQPLASDCKSVREIEKLTGINFFCNLPEDIQDEIEPICSPSDWGF